MAVRRRAVGANTERGANSGNLAAGPAPSNDGERIDSVEDMIRLGLLRRVEELHNLLGVPELARKDLSRQDLRAIAARINDAMDSLIGVRSEERALDWLDLSMRILATQSDGDPFTPGGKAAVPTSAVLQFFRDGTEHFPWFEPIKKETTSFGESRLLDSGVLARCIGGYVRALHRGRPRKGSRPHPSKWDGLRELAVHVGLISTGTNVVQLKRVLQRARLKLRQARGPLQKG